MSQDCRAAVVRRSHECREPVAAKFWRLYNAKISRHSNECRTTVVRQSRDILEKTCEQLATVSGEKIKQSDIRTNVVRHSHECLATVVRMKMKLKLYIGGNVVRHSHECLTTVVRQSRDIFSKLDRNSRICRIYKCPFNETAT